MTLNVIEYLFVPALKLNLENTTRRKKHIWRCENNSESLKLKEYKMQKILMKFVIEKNIPIINQRLKT